MGCIHINRKILRGLNHSSADSLPSHSLRSYPGLDILLSHSATMCFKLQLTVQLFIFYLGFVIIKSAITPVDAVPLSHVQVQPVGIFDEEVSSQRLLTEDVNFILSRSGRSIRQRPSRRFYKFWWPTLISETTSSELWEGSEAVMEFRVNTTTVQNITRALVNLTLVEPSLSLPLTLLATATSLSSTGTTLESSLVTIGTVQPTAEDNRVSFDVLSFVRNSIENHALQQENSAAPLNKEIRFVFHARRLCNSIDKTDCYKILDVDTRVPILKVDYADNVQNHSEDIDNVLSILKMRKRLQIVIVE